MENPIEPTEDQWSSNSFLYKIWRQRESQLLKLLTVRNLAETRRAFDKEHLSLSRYMEIMIALLANWTINRDELVIQLLDLFCCIDVNGDNVRCSAKPRAPTKSKQRLTTPPPSSLDRACNGTSS